VLGIFALGFRHGFDVDHVAAITDISGSQLWRKRAFLLCELYALGHAAVVVVLSLAIAWSGIRVPDAGRLVGATLLVLGLWVLWCVATRRPVESRLALAARGLAWIRRRVRPEIDVVHEHDHVHVHVHVHDERGDHHRHPHAPTEPRSTEARARVLTRHRHAHVHRGLPAPFGAAGAVAVGVVHGVGAETPTQVIALASGTASLLPFLAGLLLANTMAAVAAATALTASRARVLNGVVGLFSVVVGIPYLLGGSLPL